ncbi:reverse transcriptase domain-containing protein [Mesorhizobium sp. M1295]|uniref:reverse transcriptase domain-containing protein n=1 Tax=Mesorhizobium sp. M1295 TaxID=2957076 RepID=UPI00333ADA33
MTIDDAKGYLRERWPSIRVEGTYQPQPVKRVEIPKPDGGVRKLGVPCVVDRLIQQARTARLPPGTLCPSGSSPSAMLLHCRSYSYVVDLDLERFFDRVNHDSLMARVAARVSDKRALKLIRAFLNGGVMEGGLVRPVKLNPVEPPW